MKKIQREAFKEMARKHPETCSLIAMEECGELIQEISKLKRGRRHDVVTELADVLICAEFIKEIANIDQASLDRAIFQKYARLKGRMNDDDFR